MHAPPAVLRYVLPPVVGEALAVASAPSRYKGVDARVVRLMG